MPFLNPPPTFLDAYVYMQSGKKCPFTKTYNVFEATIDSQMNLANQYHALGFKIRMLEKFGSYLLLVLSLTNSKFLFGLFEIEEFILVKYEDIPKGRS